MDSNSHELTEYSENMGQIKWQDGFVEQLRGKAIEEQLHCYGWIKDHNLREVPFTEVEGYIREKSLEKYISPITDTKLIVKDGLMVGVDLSWRIPGLASHVEYILPYCDHVYDSASDNNGAGYKEAKWYKYLICLPYDHTLWDESNKKNNHGIRQDLQSRQQQNKVDVYVRH